MSKSKAPAASPNDAAFERLKDLLQNHGGGNRQSISPLMDSLRQIIMPIAFQQVDVKLGQLVERCRTKALQGDLLSLQSLVSSHPYSYHYHQQPNSDLSTIIQSGISVLLAVVNHVNTGDSLGNGLKALLQHSIAGMKLSQHNRSLNPTAEVKDAIVIWSTAINHANSCPTRVTQIGAGVAIGVASEGVIFEQCDQCVQYSPPYHAYLKELSDCDDKLSELKQALVSNKQAKLKARAENSEISEYGALALEEDRLQEEVAKETAELARLQAKKESDFPVTTCMLSRQCMLPFGTVNVGDGQVYLIQSVKRLAMEWRPDARPVK